MSDKLNEILEEIRELEKNIQEEIMRKEEEFQYKIRKRKVVFQDKILEFQKTFSRGLFRYLTGARPLNVLTAPVSSFPTRFPGLLPRMKTALPGMPTRPAIAGNYHFFGHRYNRYLLPDILFDVR